jgi:hypothetical protein
MLVVHHHPLNDGPWGRSLGRTGKRCWKGRWRQRSFRQPGGVRLGKGRSQGSSFVSALLPRASARLRLHPRSTRAVAKPRDRREAVAGSEACGRIQASGYRVRRRGSRPTLGQQLERASRPTWGRTAGLVALGEACNPLIPVDPARCGAESPTRPVDQTGQHGRPVRLERVGPSILHPNKARLGRQESLEGGRETAQRKAAARAVAALTASGGPRAAGAGGRQIR